MTQNTSLYYTPAAAAPPQGVLIFLLVAVVAGMVGGLIYAGITWYIPLIYINALVAVGYGMFLGKAFDYGLRFGKIRGTKYQKGLAFVGALIGWYCAWGYWMGFAMETGPFSMIFSPGDVKVMAELVNMMGIWSLGDSGDPVNGTMLTVIWTIEFLIIVGLATYTANEDRPFSEAGNNWAKEHKMSPRIALQNPQQFVKDLEGKDYTGLMNMERGDEMYHHTRFTMYDCEGCDDYFLHTQAIRPETNDKGEVEMKAYDVTKYIKIEPQAAREFMALR